MSAAETAHNSSDGAISEAGSLRGGKPPAPFIKDDLDRNVWCVAGVPIDVATIDSVTSAVSRAVAAGNRLSFVTPNVNWMVRSNRDQAHREEILSADLSIADGAPVAFLAKMLGAPIKSRVAGADLFEALRRQPGFSGRKMSVYFFGGREGSAEAAAAALAEDGGSLSPAGWQNPGFGDVEAMSDPAIIDKINAADPDFIVVALGAAKGQAWIERNQDRLNARVLAHLGAVVDFTAGEISRAPDFFRRAGLEWSWRIIADPALWRRYFKDAASLLKIAITRLVPQWWAAGRIKSLNHSFVETKTTPIGRRIVLNGDFEKGNLQRVRAALRDALKSGQAITLDLKGLGKVDMAFLGLLLMFEKGLRAKGISLSLVGLRRAHGLLFRVNGLFSSLRLDGDVAEGEIEKLAAVS